MAKPEHRGRYTPPTSRIAKAAARAADTLLGLVSSGLPPGWKKPPGWDDRMRAVAQELYGYCLSHDEWRGDVHGRTLRCWVDRTDGRFHAEWVTT